MRHRGPRTRALAGLAGLGAVAALTAACGPGGYGTAGGAAPPAAGGTSGAGSAPAPSTVPAAVALATRSGPLGTVLTDPAGHSVYLFGKDTGRPPPAPVPARRCGPRS
jgi:hypothetical protein